MDGSARDEYIFSNKIQGALDLLYQKVDTFADSTEDEDIALNNFEVFGEKHSEIVPKCYCLGRLHRGMNISFQIIFKLGSGMC